MQPRLYIAVAFKTNTILIAQSMVHSTSDTFCDYEFLYNVYKNYIITKWHLNNISQYLADLTKCIFDQAVSKCSLVHPVSHCLPDDHSLICNNLTTTHTTFDVYD